MCSSGIRPTLFSNRFLSSSYTKIVSYFPIFSDTILQ